MSTIFNIRNIKLPRVTRTALVVGSAVVIAGMVSAVAGGQLYQRLTTTTVVAYFTQTLALYPGDKVQIMGVKVGEIDSVEPAGDKMRVTFHYESRYQVPADATASVLNPSLVASRTIQLSPAYAGGPLLQNGAVIPIERTQVPVEWDDLRNSLNRVLVELGPTPEQPQGPIGDAIEALADGFAGKGQQINTTLTSLSDALAAVNDGSGDFYGVVKSLAEFVNALYKNDRQFAALNTGLAQFTGSFTNTDEELSTAVRELDDLLATTEKFVDDNGSVLAKDINNVSEVTTAILQPESRDGLESALHVLPNLGANFTNIYSAVAGGIVGIPAIPSFANPMQFICSSIQAASRLGYQESAELCAQYLGPILDAIKFNYLPFGVNQFASAMTIPSQVAYSESRLQPPPGYKDTTVPGIWARDTLFSHGNHEPGWLVAPGMQGLQVQAFTENMLTPDSLAALLGGADPAPAPSLSPPVPGVGATPPSATATDSASSEPVLPAEVGGTHE